MVVQQKVGSSWSSVQYYDAATTSGLLAANRAFCTHTVTYQGEAGQSYRAVVTFYAGDSTGHDTRRGCIINVGCHKSFSLLLI